MYRRGAAVVGLVSAAGVYLIEQFRQEKRRHVFNQDLARLDGQLSSLRQELEVIRQLQRERVNTSLSSKPSRRKLRSSSALSTTSTEDYTSAVDGDSSDLEFYDLSSEEDNQKNASDELHDFKEIDRLLEDETEFEKALERLEQLNIRDPNNAEVLWRLGKALKIKISLTADSNERKELIQRGVEVCKLATEIKPNSALTHKWMAILVGLRGEFQPTKERILDGFLYKQHLEEALKYTPEDPVLHHLLGRFTFEVAKLSWLERTFAATLFAELPPSTYEDALGQFMHAERLSQREWKENRLFIAKCELAIGKTESAVEWLNKAENSTSEEEEKVNEEVKNLLQQYNKRR